VQVVEFKYDQETRLAAAKALNEKTGSFKGWADDAKADLNAQLKKQINEALNLEHFTDFKPSLLSREAPISPREDVSTGLRLTVSAVVSDAEFGRFGLQASQAAPMNAFVPLAWLQAKVDQPGRANLLLTSGPKPDLKQHWTLADAGLEWRDVPGGSELRGGRVFIDSNIVAAAGPELERRPDPVAKPPLVNTQSATSRAATHAVRT